MIEKKKSCDGSGGFRSPTSFVKLKDIFDREEEVGDLGKRGKEQKGKRGKEQRGNEALTKKKREADENQCCSTDHARCTSSEAPSGKT